MAEVLRQETVGRVRVITLGRPEARNALSIALVEAIYDALVDFEGDTEVPVAILTGEDPAFCAGLDLKEAARDGSAFFTRFGAKDAIAKVAAVTKPIIGAINGATFTGGLELALGCDFLIASERAYFADTHVLVGVLPGGGMTARLPEAIGLRRARQMSMTGEIVDAARAEQIGLVNEVVAHSDLMARALGVANQIASVESTIMHELARMYSEGSVQTTGEALQIEQKIARAWRIDFDNLAARRDATIASNRSQLPDR